MKKSKSISVTVPAMYGRFIMRGIFCGVDIKNDSTVDIEVLIKRVKGKKK